MIDEAKRNLTVSNIMRYLIIFMVLFVSLLVVVSMMRGVYDLTGIIIGITFIFLLMFLKWLLGEINID